MGAFHEGLVYARIGLTVSALDSCTGQESRKRDVPSLPRLPTLPTFLFCLPRKGALILGAGSHVFAWNAKTSEALFHISDCGSLLKLSLTQDQETLIGLFRLAGSSVMASWDVEYGRRLCRSSVAHQDSNMQVNCTAFCGQVLYIGFTACLWIYSGMACSLWMSLAHHMFGAS